MILRHLSSVFRVLVPGVLAVACAASDRAGDSAEYDVLIVDGTIYDGSGGEPFRADVAIVGDRIARIGDLDKARASVVVSAEGLAVAPGFINVHSWATGSLLRDGRSMSDLKQGVTTEIFGEGITMGPLNDELRNRLATERDRDFPPPGYPITWTTLHDYLVHLEQKGVTPNVGSLVGATTIRQYVLGDEDRAPSPAELERMTGLVDREMRLGALGVGSRLAYAPAIYASTEELIALARVAGRYGGRYMSHIRSEGRQLLEAVDELIRIAREAQVGATIYHLKTAGAENWAKLDSVIERVENARAAGLDITASMYTYRAGSTGLNASIPPWAHEGGPDSLRARLRDPTIRRRIAADIRAPATDWENFYRLSGSPENLLLIEFHKEAFKPLQGMTLAQVAARRGTDPIETLMDLVLEDESLVQTVYFLMSKENLRRKIRLPWVSFGSDAPSIAAEGEFMDSKVHPRAYGTFARLLGRYVREEALIPLREAVRRLTSLPAASLHLTDRGLLREGNFADIVVFDPTTIQDHATFERPHQYATGVYHVFVNGVQALENGEHTGAMPGRALWGPGRTATAAAAAGSEG